MVDYERTDVWLSRMQQSEPKRLCNWCGSDRRCSYSEQCNRSRDTSNSSV